MRIRHRQQTVGNKHQPEFAVQGIASHVFKDIIDQLRHFVTVENNMFGEHVYDIDVTLISTEDFFALVGEASKKGNDGIVGRILERIGRQEENTRASANNWPRDHEPQLPYAQSPLPQIVPQSLYSQPIKPTQPEDRDPKYSAEAQRKITREVDNIFQAILDPESIEKEWKLFKENYCHKEVTPVPNWFIQVMHGKPTVPVEGHEIIEYQEWLEYQQFIRPINEKNT